MIGWTGQDFEPAPYPETVVVVTAEMAARVMAQGESGVLPEQQSAGPFSVRYPPANTAGGPWLTAGDKLALRPHRRGGGVTAVQTVGDRYDITLGEA